MQNTRCNQLTTLLDDFEDFEIHRQIAFDVLKQIPVSLQDPSLQKTLSLTIWKRIQVIRCRIRIQMIKHTDSLLSSLNKVNQTHP